MLVPPKESFLRKLLTPLNKFRPLIRNTEVRIFMNAVLFGSGNLLPDQDSIFNRAVWEIFDIRKKLKSSTIGKDPFIQNLFFSLFTENLDFLREMMPDLLQNNFAGIQKIYEERIKRIRLKAAKRGSGEAVRQRLAEIEANLLAEEQVVIRVLQQMPVSNLSGKYDDKDAQFVIRCIREVNQKFSPQNNYIAVKLPYGWDTLGLGLVKVVHADALLDTSTE